ncbi:hypothetical protein ACLIJR_05750 [Hydrogenophaga sp. XSHU_21]
MENRFHQTVQATMVAHSHQGSLSRLDGPPSVVGRWFKRWLAQERPPHGSLSELRRLQAIRRLIATDLAAHLQALSGRDQRLYACLTGTDSLHTVRHLRFELFDLLCRRLGEGAAVVRLKEIDAWLAGRH